MHRAIASTTVQTATSASKRQTRRLSSVWKRPVAPARNPAANRRRGYDQTLQKGQSSLALESVTHLCKASKIENVPALSRDQIRSVFFTASIPMVGFGFMDNFIMIQAGSYIDATLGVQLGLATMTAAAMGQVVSDVSGVLFGGTLERVVRPFVGAPARLSAAQKKLAIVPRLKMAGAVAGVIVGCCLGASALIFVKEEEGKTPRVNPQRQLHGVMCDMTSDWDPQAECTLHWRQALDEFSSSTSTVAMECAQEGQLRVEGNTLFLPVQSEEGIVAVLELRREAVPTLEDTHEAKHMARHLGIFWNRIQEK